MPTRQRKGRAWSLADDAKLRAAGERGPISPAVARALAGELGRSVGALQVRASQFGLLAQMAPEFNITRSYAINALPASLVFTAALIIGRNERRQKWTEISSEQRETNNAAPEINVLISSGSIISVEELRGGACV